jgi:hypothetical protein
MKTLRLLLLPFLGCFLFLIANTAIAQTADQKENIKELILGIPKVSDKTISMVTDAIRQIEGLEFVRYCPEHKLVLVKYDERSFPKGEDVVSALQKKNISMPMFIKEGGFDSVKDLCIQ